MKYIITIILCLFFTVNSYGKVIPWLVGSGVTSSCDTCSGTSQLFAWHMEDLTINDDTDLPCGCTVSGGDHQAAGPIPGTAAIKLDEGSTGVPRLGSPIDDGRFADSRQSRGQVYGERAAAFNVEIDDILSRIAVGTGNGFSQRAGAAVVGVGHRRLNAITGIDGEGTITRITALPINKVTDPHQALVRCHHRQSPGIGLNIGCARGLRLPSPTAVG